LHRDRRLAKFFRRKWRLNRSRGYAARRYSDEAAVELRGAGF
jgi:hypothetical protein